MKNRKVAIYAVAISALYSIQAHADTSWQTITAERSAVTTINGEERSIYPSCAFNQDYQFFFKQGDPQKLLVYMNGGGACWNYETCIGSLQPESPAPMWVPTLDIPFNQADARGGILDTENKDNPYRDWSIAFLPYCTGDVHFGSTETTYTHPAIPQVSATIRHRGFDNAMYARDWLTTQLNTEESSINKLMITGESAGTYGATFTYPYWRESFDQAKGFLLTDGSSGVVTDEFTAESMTAADSAWASHLNVAAHVPGVSEALHGPAALLNLSHHSALALAYPKDFFAQYTRAWDAVQVMFNNIMTHDEQPALWFNLTPDLFGAWTTAMRISAFQLSAHPNYRFYIAPGCEHTAIADNDSFFSDETVAGVALKDWIRGMTHRHSRHQWQNLICDGDCGVPTTTEAVMTCLN